MSFERIMTIGGTGLNAQLVRMNATASNLANVGVVSGSEETAFRAQRPVFAALPAIGAGRARVCRHAASLPH